VAAAPLVSVGIAAVAFKEKLSVVRLAGSGVAIAGVCVVCLARAELSLDAAVWIIVAAMIVQGIYHPLSRMALRRYSAMEVATYAMVAGTLMTIPLVPAEWARIVSADGAGWLGAAYLGLLPSALGFVLWGYAVARMPVVASTSLLYLVPAVAVLISFLWLGEIPLPSELIGGAIVIAGVATISQGDRIITRLRRSRPARIDGGRQHLGPPARVPSGHDGVGPTSPVTDCGCST